EVRLEIVGDFEHRVTRTRLAADAGEARGARLGLRDTDRVLVRHPGCEMARDDRADALVRGERGEAREIAARVSRVLIVDEARERELGDGADCGGERGEVGV